MAMFLHTFESFKDLTTFEQPGPVLYENISRNYMNYTVRLVGSEYMAINQNKV